ncbi:hypothetical protein PVL29_004440 [Vitis rotundifolia]|uniref:Uncharacterized protein n=1 Tax=Vitis rotundifolia TaxID=103349 RepID=A0AA39A8L1_VITRO|nr:hypothetical protein PVL29_004440 [Vitis rotundifolia]
MNGHLSSSLFATRTRMKYGSGAKLSFWSILESAAWWSRQDGYKEGSRMLGLVTLSTDLHVDQQCPGGPEMLANLHGSSIEPGNSDRSSGMNDESNNREMVNSGLEIPNAGDGHANHSSC